jgi:hypothetical protein
MPHAIQIRQTGGPEVLNWTPIEVGEPGSGQVRLRQAAGLNYIDVYHRTGYYPQPLPFLRSRGLMVTFGQLPIQSTLLHPLTHRRCTGYQILNSHKWKTHD